jgi:poly(A) polymerase
MSQDPFNASKFETLQPPRVDKAISEGDEEKSLNLAAYLAKYAPTETNENYAVRERTVLEIEEKFLVWVRDCYLAQPGLSSDEIESIEDMQRAKNEGRLGCILVAGSHRLDIRDVEADVDACCVVPKFCSKDAYFGSFADSIANSPGCTTLTKLPDVNTPNITFVYKGIEFDLLLVMYSENIVPTKPEDYLNDDILLGLDSKSVRSLNAPRVTNQIDMMLRTRDRQYAAHKSRCISNFKICVRFIRRWAKRRAIYSNKMGYFGGVNLNILVAYICLLYPNQPPFYIIQAFFFLWHQDGAMVGTESPVKLNKIEVKFKDRLLDYNKHHHIVLDQREDDAITPWSQEQLRAKVDAYLMYGDLSGQLEIRQNYISIITPSFPAKNSMNAATFDTRAIIREEFKRAYDLISVMDNKSSLADEDWNILLEKTDFFIKYRHYVRVTFYSTKFTEANISEKVEDIEYMAFESYMDSFGLKTTYDEIKNDTKNPDNKRFVYHLYNKGIETVYDGYVARMFYLGLRLKTDAELSEDILSPAPRSDSIRTELTLDPDSVKYKNAIKKGFRKPWRDDFEYRTDVFVWNNLPDELFAEYGGKASAKVLNDAHTAKIKAELERRKSEKAALSAKSAEAMASSSQAVSGAMPSSQINGRISSEIAYSEGSRKRKSPSGGDNGDVDDELQADGKGDSLALSQPTGAVTHIASGIIVASLSSSGDLPASLLPITLDNGASLPVKNLRKLAKSSAIHNIASDALVLSNSDQSDTSTLQISNNNSNSIVISPEVKWFIKRK